MKNPLVCGLLSEPKRMSLGSRFFSNPSLTSAFPGATGIDNEVEKRGGANGMGSLIGSNSFTDYSIKGGGLQNQHSRLNKKKSFGMERSKELILERKKEKGTGNGNGRKTGQFTIMSGSMSSFSGLKNIPSLLSSSNTTSFQSRDYDDWDPMLSQQMRSAELMLLTNEVSLDGMGSTNIHTNIHTNISTNVNTNINTNIIKSAPLISTASSRGGNDFKIDTELPGTRPNSRLGLDSITEFESPSKTVSTPCTLRSNLENLRKISFYPLEQFQKYPGPEIPNSEGEGESGSVSSTVVTGGIDMESEMEMGMDSGVEGDKEEDGEVQEEGEEDGDVDGEVEENEEGQEEVEVEGVNEEALAVIVEACTIAIPSTYKGERKLSNKEKIAAAKFTQARRALKCLDMYDDQNGEIGHEESDKATNMNTNNNNNNNNDNNSSKEYDNRNAYLSNLDYDIFETLGATPVNEDEWGDRDSDSDSDVKEKEWLRKDAPSSESAITISVAAYSHITDPHLHNHNKSVQGIIIPSPSASPYIVRRRESKSYEGRGGGGGGRDIDFPRTPTVSDYSTPTGSNSPTGFMLLSCAYDEVSPIVSDLDGEGDWDWNGDGDGDGGFHAGVDGENEDQNKNGNGNGGREEDGNGGGKGDRSDTRVGEGMRRISKPLLFSTTSSPRKMSSREKELERERDSSRWLSTGEEEEGGGGEREGGERGLRKSGKRKKSRRSISLVPEGDETKGDD